VISNHLYLLMQIIQRNARKLQGQKARSNSVGESSLWPRSGPVNKRNTNSLSFLSAFHAKAGPRARSAGERFPSKGNTGFKPPEEDANFNGKWVSDPEAKLALKAITNKEIAFSATEEAHPKTPEVLEDAF
jgi:hypothetical protein